VVLDGHGLSAVLLDHDAGVPTDRGYVGEAGERASRSGDQ
jgi:hypothetical protein